MSNRLDQQREKKLQPKRMESCKSKLESIGYAVGTIGGTCLSFYHKGEQILFYPYSGWFFGKPVKDGRGFKNLLKQLEQ